MRGDRANELRDQRGDRKVIKCARLLLLNTRSSLRLREDVDLDELLAANHSLFVVNMLGDAIRDLWA